MLRAPTIQYCWRTMTVSAVTPGKCILCPCSKISWEMWWCFGEELDDRLPPVVASLIGAHLHEAGRSPKAWVRVFEVLKNLTQLFLFATCVGRIRSFLEPALDNKCWPRWFRQTWVWGLKESVSAFWFDEQSVKHKQCSELAWSR